MILILFSLLFITNAVLSVSSENELHILQAPTGLKFHSSDSLPVSRLRDIFGSILGFSPETNFDWRGYEVTDPFHSTANFLYVVSLSQVPGAKFRSLATIPLDMDSNLEEDLFDFADRKEVPIVTSSLNSSSDSELSKKETENKLKKLQTLLDEVEMKKLGNDDRKIYWVSIPNMDNLPTNEARQSLPSIFNTWSKKINDFHGGKSLVAVMTVDNQYTTRSKRQTIEQRPISLSTLNVAEDYSEDFPVIFNIILWLSLALLFSLISISMVIAGMDPGRDSIIYRMTSTRMKRDN